MMKVRAFSAAWAIGLGLLAGCSTQQQVTLAKASPPKVATVAQVPDDGNSPEMDAHLGSALAAQGLQMKTALPAGTRKSADVDAIASYVDVWRWDRVMYLQSISVKLFDARTGDLLVTGQWRDSALHGYRDAKLVVSDLVGEMMMKLRTATGEK